MAKQACATGGESATWSSVQPVVEPVKARQRVLLNGFT